MSRLELCRRTSATQAVRPMIAMVPARPSTPSSKVRRRGRRPPRFVSGWRACRGYAAPPVIVTDSMQNPWQPWQALRPSNDELGYRAPGDRRRSRRPAKMIGAPTIIPGMVPRAVREREGVVEIIPREDGSSGENDGSKITNAAQARDGRQVNATIFVRMVEVHPLSRKSARIAPDMSWAKAKAKQCRTS